MPPNITYKEFIRQGMKAMGLKGQPASVIKSAMSDLAREWARRKIIQVAKATAEEVAERILGR